MDITKYDLLGRFYGNDSVTLLINKEMDKIMSFVKNNKDAFSCMDLKYHDAAYEGIDEKRFPLVAKEYKWCDVFDDFVQDEYDVFLEDCKHFGIYFESNIYHVGRTSSFYLYDWWEYDIRRYEYVVAYCLYEILGMIDIKYTVLNESVVDTNCEKCGYETKDFYNMSDKFVENVDDIIKLYHLIQTYKNNQVASWLGYLTNMEEQLREQSKEPTIFYCKEGGMNYVL